MHSRRVHSVKTVWRIKLTTFNDGAEGHTGVTPKLYPSGKAWLKESFPEK